jgi:hypothetical protein
VANRCHGTSTGNNWKVQRTCTEKRGSRESSRSRQSQAGQQERGTAYRITAIGPGREALLGAVKLLGAARVAAARYPGGSSRTAMEAPVPTTPALYA